MSTGEWQSDRSSQPDDGTPDAGSESSGDDGAPTSAEASSDTSGSGNGRTRGDGAATDTGGADTEDADTRGAGDGADGEERADAAAGDRGDKEGGDKEEGEAPQDGAQGGDKADQEDGEAQEGGGASDDAQNEAAKADRAEDDEPETAEEAASGDAPEAEEDTPRIQARYFGLTDVGLVREHNEDNFLVADLTTEEREASQDTVHEIDIGRAGAVFAVCDGMGGAAAGEVASQMAVDTLYEVLKGNAPPQDRDEFARRLVRAIEEAGGRIFSSAKMDRTKRGMGTTATVAGLLDQVLFLGQVGDSRAYILRNGELGLVTKDQSLVNQLIEAGQLSEDEAEAFEHSNIILQALGTTEEVSVDLTFLELRRGDRLMLCSDGLSGMVQDDAVKEVLKSTDDVQECAKHLIQMANTGGGHDNTTVVVAEFDGEGLAAAEDAPNPVYQQYPLPPEDEEGLPAAVAHEPSIKEAERKPGADVKRRVTAAPDTGGLSGMRWAIAALIAGLLIIGLVVLGSEPSDNSEAGSGSSVDETSPSMPDKGSGSSAAAGAPAGAMGGAADAAEEEKAVEVRVLTDVHGGQLVVDGKSYGPLRGHERTVELPPGAYRFEARNDGSVIASDSVTVRPGTPAEATLMVPSGAQAGVTDEGTDAQQKSPDQAKDTNEAKKQGAQQQMRRQQQELRQKQRPQRPQSNDTGEQGPSGGGTQQQPSGSTGGGSSADDDTATGGTGTKSDTESSGGGSNKDSASKKSTNGAGKLAPPAPGDKSDT